ncbi:hypothetical protein T02_10933, partial [Trichinella nativa]
MAISFADVFWFSDSASATRCDCTLEVRTSPSLDRPSVALRLGSSTLLNSTLRNTGNTDNQYCKT